MDCVASLAMTKNGAVGFLNDKNDISMFRNMEVL